MTTPAEDRVNEYNMANWGEGYFSVNELGNMEICIAPNQKGVELQAIVNAASRAGLKLPLLIRFSDILHDRVKKLVDAFSHSIADIGYGGQYTLVYPIKVNQEQGVVNELLQAPDFPIGLEAGSKPELMAVVGMLDQTRRTIICNGYKDKAYIRIALIAQQMGHQVFIVIEKRSELDIILKESARMAIKPRIGVRIRLITKGAGKWENTGGSRSKFGLNAAEVLEIIAGLQEHKRLDCLQLMHCHLGSQVGNIHDIRQCMQEVARYYIELRQLDVPITTIDVGGGLGVDYEGIRSSTDCSMNYSLIEYATNVLLPLHHYCEDANQPEPNVISESGRALTAHHAVLITNISDIERIGKSAVLPQVDPEDSYVIHDILDTYHAIPDSKPSEIYNYATHSLQEAHSKFKHGVITIKEKAKVEQLFVSICMEIQVRLTGSNPGERDLMAQLNEALAAKVFCNLSFFQSMPDAWAIGQIFPVAPITHLRQELNMHSILQDLTCDSDGMMKQYIGPSCVQNTLMLPSYDNNDPYLLGFFLVGAYQEILGNLHNLFGDTSSMKVKLDAAGQFEIHDLITGDTVTNVLQYAHYDSKKLLQSFEKQLISAVLPEEIIETYLGELSIIFSQQTYLGRGL